MRSLLFLSMFFFGAGSAAAETIELSGAGGGAASSRSGDGALLTSGRVGLRFDEHVTVSLLGFAGYAAGPPEAVPLEGAAALPHPDRRVVTGVGVDAELSFPLGRLRPYGRAGLVHQHERALRAFADDPLGTLAGTAGDARRRTGLRLGAGGALRLWSGPGAEIFATGEIAAHLFPDDRGPRAYAGAMFGLGAAFDLAPRGEGG